MEFLTQGEKLKRLRLQLNLRQKDLADENITREFISMVEKEKRNFSKQNAISIMRNILSKAEEKGINLNLDEEYIARDLKQDAEIYCLEELENKPTKEECEDLIKIAEEYDLPYAKVKILKRIGEIFFLDQEYTQSFIVHSQAMEILNANNIIEEKPTIFNNMGVCKLKLTQYEEAALYFNNSLIVCNLVDKYNIKNRVAFNLALAYSNTDEIDMAIKILESYSNKTNDSEEDKVFIKIKILACNCYEIKKDYEKCMKIYMDLLNSIDTRLKNEKDLNEGYGTLLGIIYNNMANILLTQEKLFESEVYFDKSYDVRINNDIELLSHSLIEKSRLYIKWLQYDKAKEALNKGLELSKKYSDYEYWLTALKELEKIALYENNYEDLKRIYLGLIELSEINDTEKNKIYALNNLIRLELILNNIEEAKTFSNKLNEYIEKYLKV